MVGSDKGMTLEQVLARTDSTVMAVTAPLIIESTVLIGIADAETSSCLEIPVEQFRRVAKALYAADRAPVAFHGLKTTWDHLALDVTAVKPCLVLDTKLLAYLLDPDAPAGLDLANLSRLHLGEDYVCGAVLVQDKGYPEAFRSLLAHDARLIWRLAQELPGRMSAGLARLYRELEIPVAALLHGMHQQGIGVDGAGAAVELASLEAGRTETEQQITGGASVNLAADREVVRLLEARGIRLPYLPPHRRRKMSETLEQMALTEPLVQAILDWRDLGQDLAFLRAIAGRTRIHPCWGQTRSATSRVYARDPAVQNTRRELRRLFCPAPGHVFLKADYSQAQMRIIAHLSQDPELCRVFRDSRDIHAETSAALALNDRDTAKQINFAICFGMGAAGLTRKINQARSQQRRDNLITVDQAQTYIDGFYARFPKVQEFFQAEWDRLKSMPMEERISESITGRIRRFNRHATPAVEREFRVTWPQQVEADLTKTAMLRLDRAFREHRLRARICMMIHDSVWVEAPVAEAEMVRELMRTCMEQALDLSVPSAVDFE